MGESIPKLGGRDVKLAFCRLENAQSMDTMIRTTHVDQTRMWKTSPRRRITVLLFSSQSELSKLRLLFNTQIYHHAFKEGWVWKAC